MQQHFFIEGKYLGSCDRSRVFVHAEHQVPAAYVYLCPRCGEAWAKASIEFKHQWKWVPVMRYCRKHGDGTISMWWDLEFMEALPFAVLLWEFQRELEIYDRSQNEEQS